jgi:DNA uptake protein ComE-like DNA-binding protein
MEVSRNKKIGAGVALALVISVIFSLGQESSTDTTSIAENNSVEKSQVQPTSKALEPAEPFAESDPSSIERSEGSTDTKENTAEAEKVEVKPDAQAKPVSASSFDALIAQLKVEPEFIGGYDRALFRHWIDESGNGCDTRREVLIQESLTPVTISSGCVISGGSWFSNFDGITTTDASSFDIDHFVPLSEAWRSGAHAWSSTTRRSFANDLGYEHSLIAVSASSNRSKGDKDPASWLPPRTSYHCEYIYKWVNVKIRWSLSVDPTEHSKIKSIASNCSIENLSLNPPTTAPIEQNTEPKATPTLQPQLEVAPQSTSCTDQQVDVNSASIDDLIRIIHIGEVRATELIQLRPFRTLDDLTRINGIASSRLNDIKNQAIACVG